MKRKITKTDAKTLEAMFQYWFNNKGNITATAREFKCERTRIYRIMALHRWKKRADELHDRIRRGYNRKLVAKGITNLERVETMLEKELKVYEDKDATGKVKEIMELVRYVDEIQGNFPGPDTEKKNEDEKTDAQEAEIIAAIKEYEAARDQVVPEDEDENADGD